MNKIIKLSSLFVMLFALVALCGCAPKDVDAAKEKMEEAGYLGVGYQGEGEGLVGAFMATKATGLLEGETLIATLYDSKSAAKDALEEAQGDAKDDQVAKQIGKWIVIGTEQAIKDFK